MKVNEIMSNPAITVKVDDTVRDVLKMMNDNNINGTPVIDDNDKLLGMLVKADIYRFLIQPGHIEDCPVDWVMSKEVISCTVDESIVDVAKRIRENNIVGMPVLKDDKVTGVVSFEDIIDYFLSKCIED